VVGIYALPTRDTVPIIYPVFIWRS